MKKYYGCIPPENYIFSSMAEAIGHLVAALCSAECARFAMYIETHPSRKSGALSALLPRYTLAEWGLGNIDSSVWADREDSAKKSLEAWAVAMIELNTFFREAGIENPESFVEKKQLVIKIEGRFGWSPNITRLNEVLGLQMPA